MKFLQKHKNKISAFCLAVVLLSCFMGFSFSSSADVVNDVQSFSFSNIYLEYADGYTSNGFAAYYTNLQNGTFLFEHNLPYSTPVSLFKSLTFVAQPNYTIPSYSGRALSLSYNVNFTVSDTDYLFDIPSDVDISDSAIFTGARLLIYFTDGTSSWFEYDTFLLKDDLTGDVIDPRSDAYWHSIKGSPANLSIYALFDVTSVASKTIYQTYLYFPFNDAGNIYYSNRNYVSYLNFTDVSGNIDFAYSPFQDVVQDDLTDIKGSLSGVNNKLDSLNSTINTIDEDVNRVNQTVSDLRDDLTQGDPDIESSNSDLQDQITDAKGEIGVIDSEINSIVSDILDKYPDAENPFDAPDVPILSDIWASQFIEELWGFFKAQSIFFTFIHTGLLFCLVSFILRR